MPLNANYFIYEYVPSKVFYLDTLPSLKIDKEYNLAGQAVVTFHGIKLFGKTLFQSIHTNFPI